jgi:arylsulfatase A-like enzyme
MRVLKTLCLLLGGLLLATLVLIALWAGLKIAIDPQTDDVSHLVEKTNYLARIAELPTPSQRPNIVFILFDDLGFGDLGFTGSQAIATPTMDQLAQEGLVLTNFYSPAPVCTPARAGYLTGRLPLRAGMPSVVFPRWSSKGNGSQLVSYNKRFPAEEITLADVLQASGYATGMVGKWHLGDRSPSLPNDMGFQDYFGALYSNDMEPFALYRNREIEIESPADQTRLNEWYGNAATEFIEKNSDAPFFLYFAHNFPHIPLYRPAADEGRSKAGLYGDVIEGLDDVVARVVNTLKAEGVYDNTLILITSDRGPWYLGCPGAARGRKADTFEGGMHVPMVAHWPARLEGGRELAGLSMGTDWFPTILDWLNLPLPSDRIVDGKSLRSMLEQNTPSPNEYLFYFAGEELMAVRDAQYKYHDKRPVAYVLPSTPVSFGPSKGPWLFNMRTDFNESYDVSMLWPQVSQRMKDVMDDKREEMEKNKRGWVDQ